MTIDLDSTRRSLHAVAELVLAGPQFRTHKDIRLQIRPGGFGTVVGPDVRVYEDAVVREDLAVPINGKSPATIASSLGLEASALDDVYGDGPGVELDATLLVSSDEASYLARCFAAGDAALQTFEPDAERILWPEHFDIAIRVDDINYGVAPGDAEIAGPYAYVGPAKVTEDEFWNASFGAALRLGLEPSADEIAAFFKRGRAVAAG